VSERDARYEYEYYDFSDAENGYDVNESDNPPILLKNARFAKIIPLRAYRRDFRANDRGSVVTDRATGRSDHGDDRMETGVDL
jgi:hypothetical protein